MTISKQEVISLVSELAKEEGLKVTVKESFVGGLIAGGFAMVGGIVAGPIGIAVGGAVGGCIAATRSNKFQSAAEVIMSLPAHQKQELADRVSNIIRNIDANDVAMLLFFLSSQTSLRQQVLGVIVSYIRNELEMQICD